MLLIAARVVICISLLLAGFQASHANTKKGKVILHNESLIQIYCYLKNLSIFKGVVQSVGLE